MNEIKSIGLIICILMVLMAYLKQAIPQGKTTYLMKAIISVFILLSIIEGVLEFDFNSVKELLDSSYEKNEKIWSESAELVSSGLQKEFQRYLNDEEIQAEVHQVIVEADHESFEIKKVVVFGADATSARNLLAGRYQIGLAYIEVKNE